MKPHIPAPGTVTARWEGETEAARWRPNNTQSGQTRGEVWLKRSGPLLGAVPQHSTSVPTRATPPPGPLLAPLTAGRAFLSFPLLPPEAAPASLASVSPLLDPASPITHPPHFPPHTLHIPPGITFSYSSVPSGPPTTTTTLLPSPPTPPPNQENP